jgi:AcrR family transcriptional regulator
MTDNQENWIKTGYETFALMGENSLKVEVLAKKVGISKSSFYHHFVDLDIFKNFLLEYHLRQAHLIAQKEQQAKNINPELIHILVEHKTDLLFSRQLRIHQQNKTYFEVLSQSNQIVGNEFVRIWVKDLNLSLNPKQIEGLFELALENFYLQINSENLHFQWLAAYFDNLKKIAKNFV